MESNPPDTASHTRRPEATASRSNSRWMSAAKWRSRSAMGIGFEDVGVRIYIVYPLGKHFQERLSL